MDFNLTLPTLSDSVVNSENNTFKNDNFTSTTISNSVISIEDLDFNLTLLTLDDSIVSSEEHTFPENYITYSNNKYKKRGTRNSSNSLSVNVVDSIVSVTGINISPHNLNLTVRYNPHTLTARIEPHNATNQNLTWNSSNEDVATVGNGIVTILSHDTTEITATSVDGEKTTTVTVTLPTPESCFTFSFGTISNYTCSGNTSDVVIPASIGEVAVTNIGKYVFYNNQLTSVIIPDSVTSIGDQAFYNNNLTSVDIPNSVRSIGTGAFWDNKLSSVTIPDSVRSIGDVAFNKNNLTTVTIPDSVTSIGIAAFFGNFLTSVSIKRETVYSASSFPGCTVSNGCITERFNDGDEPYSCFDFSSGEITNYRCSDTSDVVIPATVDGIAVTSIGNFAFNISTLTSVIIPDSVVSIGSLAFYSNNLTSVIIPNSVTSIGESAFYRNNLSSVSIKRGTQYTTSGQYSSFDSSCTEDSGCITVRP